MRTRIFCAAAMIALLAGPAFAQSLPSVNDTAKKTDAAKTQQERDSERAAEQAYKRSLGNIPDQGPTDPWGNARTLEKPKATEKPAATKAAATKKKPDGAN